MSGPPPPNHMPPPVPDSEAMKAKYAEIAALKKSIEEKRMAQHSNKPVPAWYGGGRRGYKGSRGAFMGRKRGGNSHRNMSLIFNEGKELLPIPAASDDPSAVSSSSSSSPSNNNSNIASFVSSVSSGGMTLINSDIYQQEALSRQRQIDATNNLKEKLRQRKIERINNAKIQLKRSKTDSCDRVSIGGEIFAVSMGGLALKLISASKNHEEKVVQWNNLLYVRQDNGDLICPTNRGRITVNHCTYFTKTGFCQKGSHCPFQHDPNHIRLCRSSLSNSCHNAQCLLSHKRTQFNTPMCRYFLDNKCSNLQCLFLHNKPEKYDDPEVEIWVCRPFSISGVCGRGLRCPFLHLYICPDFQEDGTCPRGKSCSLSHLITQTTQRMILTKKAENDGEEDVLVESEDEEQGQMQDEGENRRQITKNRSHVKKIISSYTVDPHVLFDKGMNEKYSYYIDSNPTATSKKSTSTSDILASSENRNTYSEDREFMIHLESSDSELDDLEENNDYVGLEYNAEDEHIDSQVSSGADIQEVESRGIQGDGEVHEDREVPDVQVPESAGIQEDRDVQEFDGTPNQQDNVDEQSDGELEF